MTSKNSDRDCCSDDRDFGATAAKAGIGFGTALAIAISWNTHQSILWAIVHGIFSWFYVIYFAITR